MAAIFVLIGISIMVAGTFLIGFLWSVSNGQYDDDYTPSVRMLFDNNLNQQINIKKSPKQPGKNAGRKIRIR